MLRCRRSRPTPDEGDEISALQCGPSFRRSAICAHHAYRQGVDVRYRAVAADGAGDHSVQEFGDPTQGALRAGQDNPAADADGWQEF